MWRCWIILSMSKFVTLLVMTSVAHGDFFINVSIVDPTNSFQSYHAAITSHAVATGRLWGSHFAGNTNLELEIVFDNTFPRATGASVTTAFVANRGGFNIFEQGVAAEVRTGVDPNGATPDLRFTFNSSYLQDELWFDPDPVSRTQVVPLNRTDAMSVFLHEFGHAIAFNGWQDSFDGTYPGDYKSPYDELKSFDGTNFYFNGANAVALYGGAVPVTYGNGAHIGNSSPRPGENLIPDLMNGVVFFRGTRYDISPLDLAIVADTGLNVVPVPEPMMLGSCALALTLVLKRHRPLRKDKA